MKKRAIKSDLARVDATKDRDVDFTDSPELTEEFFARAKHIGEYKAVPKSAISVRLDNDILAWLRKTGPGYQSRMNAILRAVMESSPKRKAKTGART